MLKATGCILALKGTFFGCFEILKRLNMREKERQREREREMAREIEYRRFCKSKNIPEKDSKIKFCKTKKER